MLGESPAGLPFELFPPLSDGSWVDVGTPVRTPGLADPLGGILAETIEDDDGAAFEGISRTSTLALVGGRSYKVIHYVLKDLDETRFPEIQHTRGADIAHGQLNTQTGASVLRISAGFTGLAWAVITAPENALWWRCELALVANTAGTLATGVLPGGSAVFGNAPAVGDLGSIGYFPRQMRQTSL
jgi:hypothetical protein